MPATYDDANLIVQLVRWGTEMGLEPAMATIFTESFDPEKASMSDAHVRTMLAFGETVATLVKQNVLDRDLVLDLWWVSGAWARVGRSAERERARLGEPRLYENFEALAKAAD